MPAETYRLPRHCRPERYRLELRPDLAAARFEGDVSVDVEVVDPTDRLVLNAADLEIRSAVLRRPGGGPPEAARVEMREEDQQLELTFASRLAPGPGYVLELSFTGILNDQLRGFYRSTVRAADGSEQAIATTQFEATDARRAFPCWDEPDFKAVFEVTLVVGEGLIGLSNGPLRSSGRRPDGRVALRFGPTMVMSTYLVAFVVGPFELSAPVEVDGVPVRIATVPGKLHLADYAAGAAAHALRFLGRYFGIPYPDAKLDHVAIPDFAFGAMENLGCVTYRESVLLADPATAAQTELQRIVRVISHETAHMWFGDLVTMKWWNGIWLNEAFATFMELTTADSFRPEWQLWTSFGAGRAAAMGTDGLVATRPVEYPVGRPEEAEGMFDVLTYEKGGSVLKMLEQYLGPEVFRQGISRYLSEHAHSNTETSDLWDALEEVSGEPVRSMMDSWINQGGYPMVEVEIGDDPATLVLRQHRFRYDGAHSPELWSVPVNIRASVGGREHRQRVLLDGAQGRCTLPGPVDWAVVNDGAWGFYRSRYSGGMTERLLSAGPRQVLSPLERLQLLGDLWAAVVAGYAGPDGLSEWARVAVAVSGDPDPDVWASLAAVLATLDLVGDEADRSAVARFAATLARPAWDGLGWVARPDEGDRASIARARVLTVLAQIGRDGPITAEAVRRVAPHLDPSVPVEPSEGLGPDMVGPAARIAVENGGEKVWEQALDAYRRAATPQEQLRFLYALAESPIDDLRRRTLDLTLGGEVRSQDAPFAIMAVMGQRGAAHLAWEWTESNWERLVTRLPGSLLTRVLEGTAPFVDRAVAERVHRFCDGREITVSEIRLAQILERMDVNVAMAERLRGTIAASLP